MTVFTRAREARIGLRLHSPWRGLKPLLLFSLIALPLQAEIIVFTDGAFLQVAGFEIEGERVRLELAGGGQVVMPILRVERILDDEEPTPEPEPPAPPPPPPAFSLRFDKAQPAPEAPFAAEIFAAASKHGVNPALVAAVIHAESAFQPRAISRKGARGLMQLMPATAERFGLKRWEVFDPAKNVDAGTRYLRFLADRFADDLTKVLAAYNAGEGTVDRYGGVPPYRETREYVRKISSRLGLPLES
jgi:Transglycosylase SLT domain